MVSEATASAAPLPEAGTSSGTTKKTLQLKQNTAEQLRLKRLVQRPNYGSLGPLGFATTIWLEVNSL